MPDKKQKWRLIVKKTGEVLLNTENLDDIKKGDSIKEKALELIKKEEDKLHRIHYFVNDIFKKEEELITYFNSYAGRK